MCLTSRAAHRAALVGVLVTVVACASSSGPPLARGSAPSTTVAAPTAQPAPPATAASTLPPISAVAPLVGLGPGQPVPPPAGPPKVLVTPRGISAVITGGAAPTWQVATPCGRTAAVTGGATRSGAIVVIDPGHGGVEPGTRAPDGTREADVNYAIARQAQAVLEASGIPTALTRTGDYRVPLGMRVDIARALGAQAFVSIHLNAEPDGPADRPGTETYYQSASAGSKRLAALIWEDVVTTLTPHNLAWVADTDAGVKVRLNASGGDYYGIVRQSAGIPTALAELGFLVNEPEARLYTSAPGQAELGRAVARGVARWLYTQDPGSGFVTPYPRTEPAGPGGGSGGCVDPAL